MKRYVIAALFLAGLLAGSGRAVYADNLICPTPPAGDSSNKCASTAFVQGAVTTTFSANNTWTGTNIFNAPVALGTAGSVLGRLSFANLTSGTETIQPATGALGTGVATLPAGTYNIVGDNLAQTFTNKIFDTAGAGNVFKINGTLISAVTGTGSAVLGISPTLTAPNIGAATATTINGLTISSSTGTLTIANAKTLTANNSLTLAGTDGTTLTFQGTDTYVGRATMDTLTNKTYDTAGVGNVFKINGNVMNNTTGSGSVLATNTSPTFVTPVLGAATGTSLSVTGNLTAQSGTAIPAGGTAGAGILLSLTSNFGIFFGSGAPTLSAAQGSLYVRSDGSSTSTRLYVNTNGATGWTNVTTGS